MRNIFKPLVLATLVAVGVLAFSANSAQAQVPAVGFTYSTPYAYGSVGWHSLQRCQRLAGAFLPTTGYGSITTTSTRASVPYARLRATFPPIAANYPASRPSPPPLARCSRAQ